MTGLEPATLALLAAIAAGASVADGLLAGLLGVGGGVVIVPALYFAMSLLDMTPAQIMQVAVGTSLATIVFTSLSSGLGHYRRGALDFALLRMWSPAILTGVVIGAFLGGQVDGRILMAVFSVVALIVSLDMVLRRSRERTEPRSFSRPVWAGLGVLAGGLSSMMGIGGGTICVPLLNFLGYDIRRAVGTSAAIGFVIALPAAIVYILTGWNTEGLPPLSLGYVNLLAAAIIIPLTTTFARVGVRIAHAIPLRALRLCFGLFLGLTAIRMALDLYASLGGT